MGSSEYSQLAARNAEQERLRKDNTNDALGNPIEFGKTYGYTQSSNGFSTVTIGEAIRFTPKGYVTLKPSKVMGAIYNSIPTERSIGNSASVKPIHLFPVNQ
mgnify:CR=1 FL=1